MPGLYPLKFHYQCKETVWGGNRLSGLGKSIYYGSNCGETWELGAFGSFDSVISNGFLKGNKLSEAIAVYMADLVGEEVFDKFGLTFPLLIKFIDTNDDLSVQVHPDDNYALEESGSFGKSEAWFVLEAQPGAQITLGFTKNVTREEVLGRIENNTLQEVLQTKPVNKGDFFFLPAETIHSIGMGVTLCEIQQASDITYRLYDFNRPGLDGKPRELHIDKALNVIDFSQAKVFNTQYEIPYSGRYELLKNEKFNLNFLSFDNYQEVSYFGIGSFVILICIEGALEVEYDGGNEDLKMGEVMLIPAELKRLRFRPLCYSKLIEVFQD